MTDRITTSHNEMRLLGTLTRLDTGSGNATLELWEGSRAANLTDSSSGTGTKLATITLHKPSGTIASGVLTLTTDADATVVAAGTPNYAVWKDGNGVPVMDSGVGGLASAETVKISPTNLVAGATVHVLSAVLR